MRFFLCVLIEVVAASLFLFGILMLIFSLASCDVRPEPCDVDGDVRCSRLGLYLKRREVCERVVWRGDGQVHSVASACRP